MIGRGDRSWEGIIKALILDRAGSTVLPLIAAAIILLGCSPSADDALVDARTQTPSKCIVSGTASPQPTTSDASTPSTETPALVGPPTAVPPELGPTEVVAPLTPGAELKIQRIEMVDAQFGWAIGGTEVDRHRVLRTADGGQSWREVSPPIRSSLQPDGYRLEAIFLDQRQAQVLRYRPIGPDNQPRSEPLVVWRTEDGGAEWHASNPLTLPFLASERCQWDLFDWPRTGSRAARPSRRSP